MTQYLSVAQTSPFLWGFFQDRVSQTICLGRHWTLILLLSPEWLGLQAWATGAQHKHSVSHRRARVKQSHSILLISSYLHQQHKFCWIHMYPSCLVLSDSQSLSPCAFYKRWTSTIVSVEYQWLKTDSEKLGDIMVVQTLLLKIKNNSFGLILIWI
jgi:hypothetical protein